MNTVISISILAARNLYHALMSMTISLHEIILTSCQHGMRFYLPHQTIHNIYYTMVQNACLPCVCRWGALQNFWKFLSSLQIPIFENILINTQFKNSRKNCLGKFSNNYENKLDEIWERWEKESNQLEVWFKRSDQSKSGSNMFLI